VSARFDTAVVGAGFGGLATSLELAERGERVVLYEALNYPGGCASTFEKDGYRFESAATLFSGFAPGQLFHEWIDRHGIPVELDWIDPVIRIRTPNMQLAVTRSREELVGQLSALPGAPADALESFFAEQERAADLLWNLFEDTGLLPPFTGRAWMTHATRAADYAGLLRRMGRPLGHVVDSHGLASFRPLRTYLDCLCQITVQCTSREAEAPFALAALDYAYRGTAHVRGGIGGLAWGMARAFEEAGGEVRMPERVKRLERAGSGWSLGGTRTTSEARKVVANLLPQDLRRILGADEGEHARLDSLARGVEEGWGACMLYAVVCPPGAALEPSPVHLQLVRDESLPFTDGNHVFVSISGGDETDRAPAGMRTMTVSTHVRLAELRVLDEAARAERVVAVQEAMRETLRELAPEWYANVVYETTASPRTFARFTGRSEGLVGGVPRRAGLTNYARMAPRPVLPDVYLVGDSVFPGQSTLATAVGGKKLAERLAG
jgi:phytoene dehydrogenase-like protein